MATPKRNRAENRAWMEAEILRLGQEQLHTQGPAALSLREIARDLGIASSAVYRYVADRDQLLTLLVVSAYTNIADHVESAVNSRDSDESPVRVFAAAMREWAVQHPAEWGLIYGTPVPGYAAPADQTTDPGVRLMVLLAGLLAEVDAQGVSPAGDFRAFLIASNEELRLGIDPEQLAVGIQAWCSITGTISMEVFGQFGSDTGAVGAALLRQVCDGIDARLPTGPVRPPGLSANSNR